MKKLILLLFLFLGTSCGTLKEEPKFYNIIYNQCGNITEYHDVINVSYYKNCIHFDTCYGATIVLIGGAIEIIPIDVD